MLRAKRSPNIVCSRPNAVYRIPDIRRSAAKLLSRDKARRADCGQRGQAAEAVAKDGEGARLRKIRGGAKLMAAQRPACFVRQLFDLAQIVGRPTDRTLFYRHSAAMPARRFPPPWSVEETQAF